MEKMKTSVVGTTENIISMVAEKPIDKWVVIAKCNDGDIVINKDGVIAFDIDTAKEIFIDHYKDMGVEIEIMQYEKYLELYKQEN